MVLVSASAKKNCSLTTLGPQGAAALGVGTGGFFPAPSPLPHSCFLAAPTQQARLCICHLSRDGLGHPSHL